MRLLLALLSLGVLAASSAAAQGNQITVLFGVVDDDERSVAEAAIDRLQLEGGGTIGVSYARRLFSLGPLAEVSLEIPFVAAPSRDVSGPSDLLTRDFASLYLTPGLQAKLNPRGRYQPWGFLGGGYAQYEQSTTTLGGDPNPASRRVHRAAFVYGGGLDISLLKFLGVRGEVRDFVSGNPSFNAEPRINRQHNVVYSGGLFLRF